MCFEVNMPKEDYERFLKERMFKQEARRKDADQRKTYDEVFDHRTLKLVYKFMIDGTFDTLDFPISTGKEGNVFRATDGDGLFLAVKIFRTSNSTFKNIQRYIGGDPRFKGYEKNRRKLLSAWAQKEYRNLVRMHKTGASVPRPVEQRENIIVMEFLGSEGLPFPLLKDVEVDDYQKCLDLIVKDIRLIHDEAGLVHGDLSEYNIMYSDTHHIIDVGQGMLVTHPGAGELKTRDRDNLMRYFIKKGVNIDSIQLHERMYGT